VGRPNFVPLYNSIKDLIAYAALLEKYGVWTHFWILVEALNIATDLNLRFFMRSSHCFSLSYCSTVSYMMALKAGYLGMFRLKEKRAVYIISAVLCLQMLQHKP
jgi:pimeloyl-CoA synthetase